jgi:hypothetical protein
MVGSHNPFVCLPELHCQLAVLAVGVPLIAASIALGSWAVFNLLKAHPSRESVVARMKQELREFGWAMNDDQIWLMSCELVVIGLQHLIGGLLILPALLHVGDPTTAHKLAIVGALSEVAYDVYDTLRSLYRYFVTQSLPGGRTVLIFMVLHHQLSILLVLPMNTHYGHNPYYLTMLLNLMGAGGFSLFVGHAARMLDLRTRRDLRRMRWLKTIEFAIMAYTRVVAYGPLCVCFLRTMHSDGAWRLLFAGTLALTVMGIFNAMLLPSMYRRVVKVWSMTERDFAAAQQQPDAPKLGAPKAAGAPTAAESAQLAHIPARDEAAVDADGPGAPPLERDALGDDAADARNDKELRQRAPHVAASA